ncbi:CAAX protease self-immunity [Butyrivibrio fibrisolvens DSM 3071]|uniref:CAAX protease self-immunity n=1 Tax=Butyrivibrio fibrisolvens DSM 3071 TaxID=1121131 RepID=A0A1M5WDN9_BUTFI|nr:CPBP family intramembrane glutamic endopeptidase [Butyrivibrio fibrisolvens]SHH85615.1 CAAX protease self-immunity [Butyrivibrio fibrisolvens DSM 3071]
MTDTSTSSSKKFSGIVICVAFAIMFIVIDLMISPYIDGAVGYLIKSVLRLVFFMVSLFVFMNFYDKETVSEIIHLRGFGKGLFAGIAMFLFIPFVIITYFIIGAPTWLNTSVSIIFTYLILEQIAVALWEEIVFRGFVCEGYFLEENKTAGKRIMYALISGVIFGLVHAATANSLSNAILKFALTGVWGFGFAAIYLYSHNILAAMFMHFITDVVINSTNLVKDWTSSSLMTILDQYAYFVVIGIIFIVAVIFLIKEDKNTSEALADEEDE